MEQDLIVLQNISDTLKDQPQASQRQLATNAQVSLGMMNAILSRFVERGWIMLKNVNARKLAYAVTPEGIAELTKRSLSFARRTFQLANDYNDSLTQLIRTAKSKGKTKVALFGKSNIKFLLEYICQKEGMDLEEHAAEAALGGDSDASLNVIGELAEEEVREASAGKGFVDLVGILG